MRNIKQARGRAGQFGVDQSKTPLADLVDAAPAHVTHGLEVVPTLEGPMKPQSVFQDVPDRFDMMSLAPVVNLAEVSFHVERGEGVPEIVSHFCILFALAHPNERQ